MTIIKGNGDRRIWLPIALLLNTIAAALAARDAEIRSNPFDRARRDVALPFVAEKKGYLAREDIKLDRPESPAAPATWSPP